MRKFDITVKYKRIIEEVGKPPVIDIWLDFPIDVKRQLEVGQHYVVTLKLVPAQEGK
jgi:hypothetical protein